MVAMRAFSVPGKTLQDQAAANFVVPAENQAQRRPPQRSNSDAGIAAEAAVAAGSRSGRGSDGAAGPPASGPPKQRSPQRLAAGPPAGLLLRQRSAPISGLHPTVVIVALQACCVPHALLTGVQPGSSAILRRLRLSAGSFITFALCLLSICFLPGAALHACLSQILNGLDHVVHSKGCCWHSRSAFSAFGAASDMRLCFMLLCVNKHT